MTTNLHIGRPIKWIEREKSWLHWCFSDFLHPSFKHILREKDTTIYDNNGRFQIELISKEMYWMGISIAIYSFESLNSLLDLKCAHFVELWERILFSNQNFPTHNYQLLASSGPYGPLLARSGYPGQDASLYNNPMIMICATVNALTLL